MPSPVQPTLIERCRRAYGRSPYVTSQASPSGIALVLEHLAAEILEQQEQRGAMDAHAVAHYLLESAAPIAQLAGRNVHV